MNVFEVRFKSALLHCSVLQCHVLGCLNQIWQPRSYELQEVTEDKIKEKTLCLMTGLTLLHIQLTLYLWLDGN